MAVQVKLTGLKEVEEAIKKMAKSFTADEINEVLNDAAEPLVMAMRGNVPEKTGRLQSTIGVLNRKNSRFPFTVLVGVDYTKDDGKGTMTIPALATVMEYGGAVRKPKKNEFKKVLINGEWITLSVRNPFASIPAHPYIRPALDMEGGAVQKNIVEGLYKLAMKKGKELGFDAK